MPGARPSNSNSAFSAGRFQSLGRSTCLNWTNSSMPVPANCSNPVASNFLPGMASTRSPEWTSDARTTTAHCGSSRSDCGARYSTPKASWISSDRFTTWPWPFFFTTPKTCLAYFERWGSSRSPSSSSRASSTAAACFVRFCPAMARSASCAAWSRFAPVISTEKTGYSGDWSWKWAPRQIPAMVFTRSRKLMRSWEAMPARSRIDLPLAHSTSDLARPW